MVAEEVIITLSGGVPWGFRLQGGVEHQKPLQVAKVRRFLFKYKFNSKLIIFCGGVENVKKRQEY